MNTKSIRIRITVWYTLIFSVAMAIVFVAFYLLTRQSLFSHADAVITTHNEKIVDIISREDIAMNQTFIRDSQTFSQQFSEMPGMLLIIGDPYGNILYQSQNLGAHERAITGILEKSTQIMGPAFVNQRIGATSLRFGVLPVQRNGQLQAIVLMGQPMDVIQKSLNTLMFTLAFVYAGLLVLAVSGGFLLARKALSPVALVSKQLKKISAENLKERVPEPETGDEIEELSHTFNGLLDRLDEAFVRERQFIGDVAHELKTPVSTLKGGIEVMMSKNRTNGEYRKALGETLIDINRLSTTIKNILDLAWIGAENAHLGDSHFNLSEALVELQEIAVKLASQKHITFNGEVEPGIIVGGSEDKISRAILNIIDNAMKYTPAGGSVTMSLRKRKSNAQIEVNDTGIGIPGKELAHIFERFYRGSKAAKVLGSGLGLAIAKGIIKAHCGNIQISSTVGVGTSVLISFPLVVHSRFLTKS